MAPKFRNIQIQELQDFDQKIGYVYPRYGYTSQKVLEDILTVGTKNKGKESKDVDNTMDQGDETDDDIQ